MGEENRMLTEFVAGLGNASSLKLEACGFVLCSMATPRTFASYQAWTRWQASR